MFESIYNRWYRWVTPEGGRGSGKSFSIGDVIAIISVLQERFIVLARDYKDDVDYSIWKNVISRIYEMGLESLFKITKEKITCHATKTDIIPFGLLDNPDKIKSLEGCDTLVSEECAKSPQRVWDKVVPTIRKDGATIVSIFNPDWARDATYDYLITNRDSLELGHFTRLVNYLDNPFCPESIKLEAEAMRRDDPERYKNIYLGIPKDTSDLQIFNGCYEVEDFHKDAESRFPTHPNALNYRGEIEYIFGVAIGAAQTPSFIVRCFMYETELYIDREIFDIDMNIDDLAYETFFMPGNDDGITYVDPRKESASEHFYNELAEFGGSCITADKWPSDIIDAILYMRNGLKKIVVHPSCTGVIDCLENYFWSYDEKEGEVIDKPVDKNDQAFHAIRFAISDYIQGNKFL
ncbi:TPA: hypothetical protein JG819_004696 [Vibrio parahaemolyticus]|nr:hypothetical protein [Vibrio parahaemolyticus]HAV1545596.1 hypothetical protein [Vibrio parahaemolyticus]